MKHISRWMVFAFVVVALAVPSSVRADVAPPSHPPGSNPGPETEGTQVRMMAETVVLDVLPNSDVNDLGQAKVSADFTMRNLGNETESMGVRFPISSDNGFGQYPELQSIAVKVDGKTIPTKRIMEADPMWGSTPVPWAQFDVTFPPNQDVQIEVSYVLSGTGEYPFVAYYYVLHTGAGWNGTIGSADLIVRLPYEANTFNVLFDEEIGWSFTTVGGVIAGNEVKWHFDDLEPDTSNDFQLSLVNPAVWKKALNEQSNLQKDPNDGEAWGRLGKLYKEMFFFRRDFRHDAGGQELYQLSVEAYENALKLLPDDALWHAGFADLLAVHAYYASWQAEDVTAEMLRSMQEIDRALELSPNDAKVNEIAEKIYYLFPDAVDLLESGYDFLWLTATPVMETPTSIPASPTSTLEATPMPLATETVFPTREAVPNPTEAPPTASNPLCGSAALVPLALLWFVRRRVIPGNPLL
jgi:hypothetical protein